MPCVIFGVVRDPEGNAVVQARCAFSSGPVQLPDIAALTNSTGAFSLAAPVPGTYVVQCSADGFAPASLSVLVTGNQNLHVDMRLRTSDG
jgi:hypothetical protein